MLEPSSNVIHFRHPIISLLCFHSSPYWVQHHAISHYFLPWIKPKSMILVHHGSKAKFKV